MINYIKSERYRLFHKKKLYLFFVVCLGLLAFHCWLSLSIFHKEQTYHREFFYAWLMMGGFLIALFVGIDFVHLLTGKDNAVLKQEVSFGIPRHTIFLTKFGLTLLAFLMLYVLVTVLGFIFGQILLPANYAYADEFLPSVFNLLPICISAFAINYCLALFDVGSGLTVLTTILVFFFSGGVSDAIIQIFPIHDVISKFFPSNLLSTALGSDSFSLRCWGSSAVLTVVVLVVGMKFFSRKNIQ